MDASADAILKWSEELAGFEPQAWDRMPEIYLYMDQVLSYMEKQLALFDRSGEGMLTSLIQEWKAQGLAGIEVYHPSAQNNHAAFLLRLARAEGLLVTGGSDFHGEGVRKNRVGEGLERWADVQSDTDALLSRIHLTR